MVKLNPYILDYIVQHANTSDDEIFGWLVGYYTTENEPIILEVFDCQNYLEQTLISATPDPLEFQSIVHMLPSGLGVIGIYHSHPHGSDIFHSSIDDSTLIDYSSIVGNFVSIVTNGIDAKVFVMKDKESRLLESVEYEIGFFNVPKFLKIKANLNLTYEYEKDDFTSNPHKISSNITTTLFQKWDTFKYLYKGKEISKGSKIKSYFSSDINKNKYIELEINNTENSTKEIQKSEEKTDQKTEQKAEQKSKETNDKKFNLSDSIIILHFSNMNKSFEEINDEIKNRIIQMTIMRISKGIFKSKNKWKIAECVIIPYMHIPLFKIISRENKQEELSEMIEKQKIRLQYIKKFIEEFGVMKTKQKENNDAEKEPAQYIEIIKKLIVKNKKSFKGEILEPYKKDMLFLNNVREKI